MRSPAFAAPRWEEEDSRVTVDLQALIERREAEARAEQTEARRLQRLQEERERQFLADLENFRSTAASWLTGLVAQFGAQLRASAEITNGVTDSSCWIMYRRRGGRGRVADATLAFRLNKDSVVTWASSLSHPAGSAPYSDLKEQTIRGVFEEFLTAVLGP
jgi:hypothetical protein